MTPFEISRRWQPRWFKIALANPWIGEGIRTGAGECELSHPDDIYICHTPNQLAQEILASSCWGVGVAFCWKDICLINQAFCASEMLVIKQDLVFDSWSCWLMEEEELLWHIQAVDRATTEQCRALAYLEA